MASAHSEQIVCPHRIVAAGPAEDTSELPHAEQINGCDKAAERAANGERDIRVWGATRSTAKVKLLCAAMFLATHRLAGEAH